ncbi:PREDICTED: UDP-glucuronosyltransferase 1-7-like isoform X2 [Wasmannia auropunctata]|uniref:UDP-glucuronosyltransferase 1-7-like isoform X2 n=1 Tax=Wasmannia auropunctata TaxID=64793 RepID=UPI0005F0BC07|nr:PREDICTED: UDP-glucuronosyltransferase 1-7-like isoform X2 [Wasmannia auropunctata]
MSSCFILMSSLVCCVLISFVTASKPLSILVIQPVPITSHHIWVMNLIKELLRKGHHVHVVSIHETEVENKLAQNLTYTVFDSFINEFGGSEDLNFAEWAQHSSLYMIYFMYYLQIHACDTIIETKAAKELLEMIKSVEFDVIVLNITIMECLYGLLEIAKGKPPVVGYIPLGPAPWVKDYIGGPNYPTVRPYPHVPIAKPVGLWQRTWNALHFVADDVIRHYYYLPTIQRHTEKYMGCAISHPVFYSGIPLPPNALEVAGLNAQTVQPIADEVVTYPENMRTFLDEAKNGAIIISLGTNVKWKFIGLDKIKIVISALSKLKQRVLWKLDIKVPFEIPDNLMIVKWMPQNKILTHKNVRAIWTHGGLLSVYEAIWKDVPMIVMPFFRDQKSNAEILVDKGVGTYLDVRTLTVQNVLHAIEEILYNESYARNMKQLSSEFRDRPLSPLDLAVWSIEYSVRHPNGSLATPLRSQSWIEQNLIDVYAFLFFILIIILLSIYLTIKILINLYYNHTSKLGKNKQA